MNIGKIKKETGKIKKETGRLHLDGKRPVQIRNNIIKSRNDRLIIIALEKFQSRVTIAVPSFMEKSGYTKSQSILLAEPHGERVQVGLLRGTLIDFGDEYFRM